MDSEHARRAVGQVAVPFGICAEPSNVKAGGGACPFRFRCAGCDHFRTDVSYLPDLHAYLDDLLRTRERVLAATDLDDWARAEAMPSEEEIRRIRRLIDQISHGLDDTRTRTATTPSTSRHRRAPPPQHHARHAPHPPNPARPTPGENPGSATTPPTAKTPPGHIAKSPTLLDNLRPWDVYSSFGPDPQRTGGIRHWATSPQPATSTCLRRTCAPPTMLPATASAPAEGAAAWCPTPCGEELLSGYLAALTRGVPGIAR